MADVINEVVENSNEVEKDINQIVISGPTIFKTSRTSKIVFGSVIGIAVTYGLYKGIKCLKKKKAVVNDIEVDDISEEIEDADFKEVEEE